MAVPLWRLTEADESLAESLATRLKLRPTVARILVARGFGTPEAIAKFLGPRLGELRPPAGMADLELVLNRLQAALFREIFHLVSTGVVSVADADAAVSWGPGLRWGVMGPSLLSHLAGGAGGIDHFFDQFSGPMTAWWKVLGAPQITPELRKAVVDGVHAEAGQRSIDALAAQRDETLLGLLALRAKEA